MESLDGPLMPEVDNNWKIVGADLDDPQKDLIYEKVRAGEIEIPTSEDGRTPNIASLNGPALRAEGVRTLARLRRGDHQDLPNLDGGGVLDGSLVGIVDDTPLGSGAVWARTWTIPRRT